MYSIHVVTAATKEFAEAGIKACGWEGSIQSVACAPTLPRGVPNKSFDLAVPGGNSFIETSRRMFHHIEPNKNLPPRPFVSTNDFMVAIDDRPEVGVLQGHEQHGAASACCVSYLEGGGGGGGIRSRMLVSQVWEQCHQPAVVHVPPHRYTSEGATLKFHMLEALKFAHDLFFRYARVRSSLSLRLCVVELAAQMRVLPAKSNFLVSTSVVR